MSPTRVKNSNAYIVQQVDNDLQETSKALFERTADRTKNAQEFKYTAGKPKIKIYSHAVAISLTAVANCEFEYQTVLSRRSMIGFQRQILCRITTNPANCTRQRLAGGFCRTSKFMIGKRKRTLSSGCPEYPVAAKPS